MSLALLSGVNPRACKETGPRVRIHEGKWKLNAVGLVDSELTLLLNHIEYPTELEFVTEDGMVAQIVLKKRGTEQHFSVFAELVTNGTVISTT